MLPFTIFDNIIKEPSFDNDPHSNSFSPWVRRKTSTTPGLVKDWTVPLREAIIASR
jgi:hypothetical protein